jgi:hypothetical protein
MSATDWDARYTALYRMDDSLKTVRTLRETPDCGQRPRAAGARARATIW